MNVDLDILPEHLQKQRWFAGKAWPITHVELIDHVKLIDGDDSRPDAVLAVLEVHFELGHPQRYLVPVTPEGGGVREALERDDVARAMLGLIRGGADIPAASGTLKGSRVKGAEARLAEVAEAPVVRRLELEQSNSSVVFDEKVILKVIRKLEPGVNPEMEVGAYLATQTDFRHTPEMLGALQLEGPVGATVAVLHRFVQGAREGWTHLIGKLRESAPTAELMKDVAELGRCVAELHLALGRDTEEPGFAPEPLAEEDLQRWSSSIIGELGVTLAEASNKHPDALELREPLVAQIQRLAHLEASGKRIRIHGDLHLSQILVADGEWLVFDFEGEPGRAFSQRREKHTPLKDVSGMLRSFAYAAATIRREGGDPGSFEEDAREALLSAYLDRVRPSGLLPSSDETLFGLLDALELEKLLYEIRYELNNRPEWLPIPIAHLREQVRRAEGRSR